MPEPCLGIAPPATKTEATIEIKGEIAKFGAEDHLRPSQVLWDGLAMRLGRPHSDFKPWPVSLIPPKAKAIRRASGKVAQNGKTGPFCSEALTNVDLFQSFILNHRAIRS